MKANMNIRSIIIIAIICLFSMVFINMCFAANTGKIAVETVKLRKEPNTDATVLELASLGEEVEVLEKVEGWYKVKYKKITGYIREDLLDIEEKAETNNIAVVAQPEENSVNNETSTASENANINTDNTNTNTSTEQQPEENIANNSVEISNEKETNKKYKVSEDVKMKIIPLIIGIEIDEVKKDSEIQTNEILNDWAKVKTIDGKEGWVRTEKLVDVTDTDVQQPNQPVSNQPIGEQILTTTSTTPVSTPKTKYINSQTVNLREGANKTSSVLEQLTINTKVSVLSDENGWAKVEVNGKSGYIASNLLSDTKQETSRSSVNERASKTDNSDNKSNDTATTNTATNNTQTVQQSQSQTASVSGNAVVEYAKQFLGCKYVYGGTTTNGFDCSGFTQFVYKHFGISINRTAAAQYSNGISVKDLQPGDLVMFGKSGINHVGIYIGGNSFIHAANKTRGVTIDTLSTGYYYTNYVGARRIL